MKAEKSREFQDYTGLKFDKFSEEYEEEINVSKALMKL